MNAEEIIAANNALAFDIINYILAKPMFVHLSEIPEIQDIVHSSTITPENIQTILDYVNDKPVNHSRRIN